MCAVSFHLLSGLGDKTYALFFFVVVSQLCVSLSSVKMSMSAQMPHMAVIQMPHAQTLMGRMCVNVLTDSREMAACVKVRKT